VAKWQGITTLLAMDYKKDNKMNKVFYGFLVILAAVSVTVLTGCGLKFSEFYVGDNIKGNNN